MIRATTYTIGLFLLLSGCLFAAAGQVSWPMAWLPVTAHIFVRLWPFMSPGFSVSPLYQVLWFTSFHLSSLVMVYVLVESFRFYMTGTGNLWKMLSRNSYGVYIIHVVLIGVFGTFLLNSGLPAVVKWIVLILATYAGSNLLVALFRPVGKALAPGRPKPAELAAS